MKIYGKRNKEKFYNVKFNANNSSITTTKENIMESTTDTPISLDTNTLCKTSTNSPCIKDLENFIDSQVDFVCKKKPVEDNSLYIGQQSFLSQMEHVVCKEDTISHLREALDCKQKVIENLLHTLKSYLHSKSNSHSEKHPTSNFDLNNVNKSDTAIYTNKETINIDKETINNNQKQNKKCITVSNQQSNQRHTDNIIETTI